MKKSFCGIWLLLFGVTTSVSYAGSQHEEKLSSSVQSALHKAVSDQAVARIALQSDAETQNWLWEMSHRLAKRMPDLATRLDFLRSVHYEATRAGLDPQLVLGIIEVESNFRKYAVSIANAMGYMQVMPFWVKLIGSTDHNLFHLRTNLRYGCTILRHYLDLENGDLYRALGRYNGSLGRPEYPNAVLAAWQKSWEYPRASIAALPAQ